MRRMTWCAAWGLLAMVMSTTIARGDSTTARLESLEAEIVSLRGALMEDHHADAGCSEQDDCSCCSRNGVFAEFEMLLFGYARTDGLRMGDNGGEDVPFALQAVPRISVGYVSSSGLGARVRWYEFDRNMPASGMQRFLGVDATNVDFELFQNVHLGCGWSVEFSGGVRYNEFHEQMADGDEEELRINTFDGIGGILGVEARREFWCGRLFGRLRGGVIVGDRVRISHDGDNNFPFEGIPSGTQTFVDSVHGIWELAVGYEMERELANGSLLFARFGAEAQLWENYSSNFVPFNGEESLVGHSDVGFYGVTLSLGIAR